MSTSMPQNDPADISAGTQIDRSWVDYDATGDRIIVRFSEAMPPALVADLKAKLLAFFETLTEQILTREEGWR